MNHLLWTLADVAGGGATDGGLGATNITTLDIVVTVGYLVGIVTLGCWAGFVHKKKGGEAKEYFLAGGTLRWPVIGLALFATNISCVHLVSLAQSGFDTGLLNGNFEWMAAFTLMMLGLFFAPFYIRSGVATLPDFLERRYSRECRDWLAVLSMVSAIMIHIGFSFLTGGIVMQALFGIDPFLSIVVIAALTGLYTIVGGLMAVVVTEAIQTVVLLLGAAIITWFAWDKMGGWTPMHETLTATMHTEKLSMLRPPGDSSGMPWYSIFLGYPVLGIWYWCADQTIVQRVLGARSEQHARVGPLFAGLIKILPVFIFVMPGMFAFTLAASGKLDLSSMEKKDVRDIRVLVAQEKVSLDLAALEAAKAYKPADSILDLKAAAEANLVDEATAATIREQGIKQYDTKGVYGAMITQLLPTGLTGVMVAALLAALMSTVSGALNSISTLFSYDLYKRMKPQATDHQLVFVGRISAGVALLLAMGLVPLLNKYDNIFNGLNDIIAHIAPPVTCVFLLGVFWPKASATSAKLTLWLGSALGVLVFAFNKLGDATPIGPALSALSGGSFMMMAFYLLCACMFMQAAFTLAFPAGEREIASKLYWSHPFEPLKDPGWPGIGNYKFLAFALLAIMAVLYYLFR